MTHALQGRYASEIGAVGQHLARYKESMAMVLFKVLAGAAASITGLSGFIYLGGDFDLLVLVVASLLLAAGVGLWMIAYQTSGREVLAGHNGIAKVTREGTRVILWRHVRELDLHIETGRQGRWLVLKIFESSGKMIRFDAQTHRPEQMRMAECIQQSVAKLHAPAVLEDLECGRTASFGAISLSPAGIRAGKHHIAWEAVERIRLRHVDRVAVRHGGHWTNLARVEDVTNWPVLQRVVTDYTTAA